VALRPIVNNGTGGSNSAAGAGTSGADGEASTLGGSNGHSGGASAIAGGQSTGGSDSGSSGTAARVTMAEVQAIFDSRCVLCHDASKLGLPSFPGLPLTAGASRAALVNQVASEIGGGTLVIPSSPNQSDLIQKLTSTTPYSGAQMPRPYELGPPIPLTADQINTITTRIAKGAPE
jgi:mono/diheme cytochrome c family protein